VNILVAANAFNTRKLRNKEEDKIKSAGKDT